MCYFWATCFDFLWFIFMPSKVQIQDDSQRVETCRPRIAYLLTSCCRVPLEQLTGLQLVKKFPTFHGTWRFITALTSVRHLSLSWATPIQSIYPHPTSWRSILILSTHLRLGLPSGLLPSCFPTKNLYSPLSSPIRATCPAHLVLPLSGGKLGNINCFAFLNHNCHFYFKRNINITMFHVHIIAVP